MERGYLYGDARERARTSAGPAHAREGADAAHSPREKPVRPRESSAMASPYRTPIAAATFYGKNRSPLDSAAARKRGASDAGSPRAKHTRTAPLVADAPPAPLAARDSSPDELDVLPPTQPLHARMRRKDAPPAPPPSSSSITVPLRAMYIGEWYARDDRLELVSFPTHFAVMLGARECAKVALRDVFNWTIGGETHRLFVLVVKRASARALLQLAPDPSLPPGRVQVYFWAAADTAAHTSAWDALVQRVRHTDVRRAQLLPEAGAASLAARLEEAARHPMRLPDAQGTQDAHGTQKAAAAPAERDASAATPAAAPPAHDAPVASSPARASSASARASSPVSDSSDASVELGTRTPRRSARHQPTSDDSKPILRYPPSGRYAVTLLSSDVRRLDEDEYLNDTVIEFGLRYFLEQIRVRDARLADQIHLFNSFFFQKVTEFRDRSKSYELVRKWTKGVDIFAKRYLVVPINEHMHWYLAIVVNPAGILHVRDPPSATRRSARTTPDVSPATSEAESHATPSPAKRGGPTRIVPGERRAPPPPPEPEPTYVLVLDSLGSTHTAVKTALRDYLRLEARDKQRVPPDTDVRRLGDAVHVDVHVATQPNFCDCGLYLLHNFQCFFSDPQVYLRAALASRRAAAQPDDVWRAGDMAQYRRHWQSLIRDLSATWQPPDPDVARDSD